MKQLPRFMILTFLLSLFVGTVRAARVDEPAAALLTYKLKPGETMRYKLTAKMNGSLPMFDEPKPVDLEAVLTLVYLATPKTLMADGSSDVEFKVESADVEVQKIPFEVPIETIQKVLDQTVTLSKTGEVIKGASERQLPVGISIPGLDPTRLYALLFPVVFRSAPVKPGDTWSYKSELLGGPGSNPKFSATVLVPTAADKSAKVTRLRENVEMKVDVKVDSDKKPVTADTAVYKTRKGLIQGSGILQFDRTTGRFTKSDVEINANIQEDLVGEPKTPDEPKQVISKVHAIVAVQLMPPGPMTANAPEKDKKVKR